MDLYAAKRFEPGELPAWFVLPIPPSTNQSYKVLAVFNRKLGKWKGIMAKTYEALQWEDDTKWLIKPWTPPKGPLSVSILCYRGKANVNRADIDGIIKPLLDAVVGKHKDQNVRRLLVTKELSVNKEPHVVVLVEKL